MINNCQQCELHKYRRNIVKGRGSFPADIIIIGEAPGKCFSGNTFIDTAFRDKSKFPKGIHIKDLVGKSNFKVYSYDLKNERIVLGNVKKVWCTGKQKVYKITFEWIENNSKNKRYNSIKVTSNQLLLLKKYLKWKRYIVENKKIKERYLSIEKGLDINFGLEPFNRCNSLGYSIINSIRDCRFLLECKIGRKLKKDEQCHHIDGNKLNDSEDNLQLLTIQNHTSLHATGKNNCLKNPIIKKRFPLSIIPSLKNHRVIKIEYAGIENVYDMEIEKYNNFAANGIFVHNSEDMLSEAFTGIAGQLLQKMIDEAIDNIKYKPSIFFTNSVLCRPTDKIGGDNREPNKTELFNCHLNVISIIDKVNPKHIIFAGDIAEKNFKIDFPHYTKIMHPSAINRLGGKASGYYLTTVRILETVFRQCKE
jgi:uracil-DNA glycosylase family 4